MFFDLVSLAAFTLSRFKIKAKSCLLLFAGEPDFIDIFMTFSCYGFTVFFVDRAVLG